MPPCPKCNDNGTVQVIQRCVPPPLVNLFMRGDIKLAGELRERPCRWCPREAKTKGRRKTG